MEVKAMIEIDGELYAKRYIVDPNNKEEMGYMTTALGRSVARKIKELNIRNDITSISTKCGGRK